MSDRPLRACPVKGCPWRRPEPDACPVHEDAGQSQIRKLMMRGDVAQRRQTRHR
ncbi:hypothetical protein K8W59_15140 [Nocardioides rotundus]|uniref:hypothetical protein n=1 Tax=Nocardioides rotundus TaxID=1774216 RepID=UPI001CBBF03F|nr:hypothetical protein [Nocardioides rotundus]UAL29115.1 hypothetical protein K8W59_15140 [Nocardioides rotundus]